MSRHSKPHRQALRRPASTVRAGPKVAIRMLILAVGHLSMLVLLHLLLEWYQPNPNGFRFDTMAKVGGLAVFTAPPVLIGVLARSGGATALIAAGQAASPLLLRSAMRDPGKDLNFAILLWWFPLPAAAAAVVLIDRVWRSGRLRRR